MKPAAVVGLGMIGGSAALALCAVGWDRDEAVRTSARRRGIPVADSLEEALEGAGLILVAVPTEHAGDVLRRAAALAPRALLTDAASLKVPSEETALSLPAGVRYVGGHPMAGGTGSGVEAASATLFENRPWLLVPTPRSDGEAIELLSARLREIGALPAVIDAKRHDAVMAWVSHLPLAVAAALARVARRGAGGAVATYAGPGLIDTTRLAETPLSLARELFLADPQRLAAAVEAMSDELAELAERLRAGNAAAVEAFLREASQSRADIVPRTKS